MKAIEIYAWGDPREAEEKAWCRRAKAVALVFLGIAAGYIWAILQGVK